MNNCKKCGAPLLIGSKLCRKCGTLVDTPVKRICPKCKSEVSEGLIFCNKCGERLAPFAVGSMSGDSRMRTLTVSRDLSVWGCAKYKVKVIVNGNLLGNMPVGGELRTTVASDTATVEIICATLVSNERRLILKLGENPRVTFKIQRSGMIGETVYDAEVMERR